MTTEARPRCSCHGEPMHKQGFYPGTRKQQYRCRVKQSERAARHAARYKASRKGRDAEMRQRTREREARIKAREEILSDPVALLNYVYSQEEV